MLALCCCSELGSFFYCFAWVLFWNLLKEPRPTPPAHPAPAQLVIQEFINAPII